MISINLKKRALTSLLLFFLIILIFNSYYIFVLNLLIVGVLSILEFLNISRKISKSKLINFFLNIFFIFYIFLFCYLFLFFNNFYQLKIITFSLLIGCIASDIGGYIFGNIFKGPRLTKISPKKTISGAIGSILFTFIFLSFLLFYFTGNFNLNTFIISVFTSVGCQLGDLFFSLLKRKAKLKDTGNVLPGHGGVLDRIDGILFGIPVGFITLILTY